MLPVLGFSAYRRPGAGSLRKLRALGSAGHERKGRQTMPAKSKAQQKAAGAALAAKRGETGKDALKGASREMFDSMSEKELEDLAETKRKGLPEHKSS
jgi:hypothetical protein